MRLTEAAMRLPTEVNRIMKLAGIR